MAERRSVAADVVGSNPTSRPNHPFPLPTRPQPCRAPRNTLQSPQEALAPSAPQPLRRHFRLGLPTWKPGFYPADVPSRAFLHHYASQLTSVEVNYTFRTLPCEEQQLEGWLAATPPGFPLSASRSRSASRTSSVSATATTQSPSSSLTRPGEARSRQARSHPLPAPAQLQERRCHACAPAQRALLAGRRWARSLPSSSAMRAGSPSPLRSAATHNAALCIAETEPTSRPRRSTPRSHRLLSPALPRRLQASAKRSKPSLPKLPRSSPPSAKCMPTTSTKTNPPVRAERHGDARAQTRRSSKLGKKTRKPDARPPLSPFGVHCQFHRADAWLANGHLQTIFGNFLAPPRRPSPARSRSSSKSLLPAVRQIASPGPLPLPLAALPERPERPTVIVLHGLEGSSNSQYVVGNANKLWRAGLQRHPHEHAQLRRHRAPHPPRSITPASLPMSTASCTSSAIRRSCSRISLVGYSMGGNLMLKLAGDLGPDAPPELRSVIGVSPPSISAPPPTPCTSGRTASMNAASCARS